MTVEKKENVEDNKPSPIRIEKIKLTSYRFFNEEFILDCKGQNVLIFGENGTGKSSIYKALELLSKKDFETIEQSRNIFSNESPEISFTFSDESELILNQDTKKLPSGFEFIHGLSVFAPMIDYKKLLKIHYSSTNGDKQINVFNMFRELFKDFPVGTKEKLSSIEDANQYSVQLQGILFTLLEATNEFLKHFDKDYHIKEFKFENKFTRDNKIEPIINIVIAFKEEIIENYHSFLNEARLSALAISIYFASIHILIGALEIPSLKILVLDDLIISLDMSNRLKILKILKEKFSDFQIFFFTHDKELYELFKREFQQKYELYIDDYDEKNHKTIIIKGGSELDRAKKYYAQKDIEACGVMLRKALERKLKKFIPLKDQRDKDCKDLDLSKLLSKAKSMVTDQHLRNTLEEADKNRTHILNKLAHNDYANIHSVELKDAIGTVEKLERLLVPDPGNNIN